VPLIVTRMNLGLSTPPLPPSPSQLRPVTSQDECALSVRHNSLLLSLAIESVSTTLFKDE
jgi:hypothetical protein